MKETIAYKDIYWTSFSPSAGHEYKGRRPALVIQSDRALTRTNLVTVMPLSSQVSKCHEDDVLIKADGSNHLVGDSIIKVHHIESFDRSRFIKKIGVIDAATMDKVKKYLGKHFGI